MPLMFEKIKDKMIYESPQVSVIELIEENLICVSKEEVVTGVGAEDAIIDLIWDI